MSRHPRAGLPALGSDLVPVPNLITAYFTLHPDPADAAQLVSFGTSGHRGSAFALSFNEDHIAAIAQAICDHRSEQGIAGPLYLGSDTHALSAPAWATAVCVLAANGVRVTVDAEFDSGLGHTPTPAVSLAILLHNRGRAVDDPGRADGIVITPSHNPPRDGGFKYNPPNGGPADAAITTDIQDRANAYLAAGLAGVRTMPLRSAMAASTTGVINFRQTYVDELASVVDMDAIRGAHLSIAADPLGGASVDYWPLISDQYGIAIDIVHPQVDPTWAFMTLDWDGQIRMDCSSPDAMASLIAGRGSYDIATGNDADSDRHGIVTRDGLMNPNHYLAASIDYLFRHRTAWPASSGIGKTVVSSSMIDRVARSLGRPLMEVPVGFKWFVDGLLDSSLAFGGEESAGASFLRRDGSVWTTDKDGIIAALLASEMLAVTGISPSQRYRQLTEEFGDPVYARIDAPASREQKVRLGRLSPADVQATELGGQPITAVLTAAPGNGAPIGGLKVTTDDGWFAARPSGTEDVYKIYAESFRDAAHLAQIQAEAQALVDTAINAG
ncbi:MAG: phosphoglucomutase (alpha-D-glucose-1,6-bisphosphate-dependent) [Candidatus Nanopelagicales bacterium]|nr:phosphoglucomutase (alpha-D-glucose-1,6-bisphosphate-dependent) [Candidatus Nanopelagicales bacterium]